MATEYKIENRVLYNNHPFKNNKNNYNDFRIETDMCTDIAVINIYLIIKRLQV